MEDFLKKNRQKKSLTAKQLGEMAELSRSAIASIESDSEVLGEHRAKKIGDALGIPEDVMTIYRGHLPSYAKKTYREKSDELEKAIRKSVKKLEKEE